MCEVVERPLYFLHGVCMDDLIYFIAVKASPLRNRKNDEIICSWAMRKMPTDSIMDKWIEIHNTYFPKRPEDFAVYSCQKSEENEDFIDKRFRILYWDRAFYGKILMTEKPNCPDPSPELTFEYRRYAVEN